MVQIVAEFLGICGLDVVPPDNIAELIPYLLTVVVGVVMVVTVFKVISALAQLVCNWRWFK